MGLVGIIVNPASGKDIRRMLTYASRFTNREKANILERIISAIGDFAGNEIYVMPDGENIGPSVVHHLIEKNVAYKERLHIYDMEVDNSIDDTISFTEGMKAIGADVLIVLGGDGTSRATAKAIGTIPMIPVSTGTNNVFPQTLEGTIVGMAAAAIASGRLDPTDCCIPCKRIEIYSDNQLIDIALIDLVVSSKLIVGARAIWNKEEIFQVIVTQCHPATIGFSALIGCSEIVEGTDDFGMVAQFSQEEPNYKAAMAAGLIVPIHIKNKTQLPLEQNLLLKMDHPGILALDGEREIPFEAGTEFTIRITRQGPNKVDLRKTLELAQKAGLYRL